MQIFFSVGEASGDEHAAMLIRELKSRNPDCECVGYGGEEMEAAGCRIIFPLTTMAVMGIVKVLPMIGKFFRLAFQAERYFREHRPDAVVLIDFPGFNWWIAHYAKKAGIPVYYYMPPQLWAWAGWRVKRIKKNVDHVLSGLSFETEWYRQQGVETTFVGHPFFEEVASKPLDEQAVCELRNGAEKVVGLLPGSRKMELSMNWPVMLKVVERISALHPQCRFIVANHKPHHREFCEQKFRDYGKTLPISFEVGRTSEVIEAADCCLMVSGSVSLELLARKTPAVVLYRAGWVMGLITMMVIRCKYITLPNLISDQELYPEFPFINPGEKTIAGMSAVLDRWLSNPEELEAVERKLADLSEEIAESKASEKTAGFLLQRLDSPKTARKAA